MGERTPDEQAILDAIERDRGRAFVERFAELILAQARAIGELPQLDGDEPGHAADQPTNHRRRTSA